jgi:hypothetical protein
MNKINCIRGEDGLMVDVDGRVVQLKPSLKVWNHSPSGFEIGYGGSGPAQLALAILMMFTDRDTASRLHQDFKWEILADPKYQASNFPGRGEIEIAIDIPAWVKAHL